MIEYDIFRHSGSYAVHFSATTESEAIEQAMAYAEKQKRAYTGEPVTDGATWLVTVLVGADAKLPEGATRRMLKP